MTFQTFNGLLTFIVKTLFPIYEVNIGLGKDYQEFLKTETIKPNEILCSYQSHEPGTEFENGSTDRIIHHLILIINARDGILDEISDIHENLSEIEPMIYKQNNVYVQINNGFFENQTGKSIYNLSVDVII